MLNVKLLVHHVTSRLQKVNITLANDQLDAQILNTFITTLYTYMFRTISCSSSGGQIVLIQHLVSSLSVSDRPVHRLRKELQFSNCAPYGHLLTVTIPHTVLTLRLLMSYTYGAPILDVSRSHTTTQHSR